MKLKVDDQQKGQEGHKLERRRQGQRDRWRKLTNIKGSFEGD